MPHTLLIMRVTLKTSLLATASPLQALLQHTVAAATYIPFPHQHSGSVHPTTTNFQQKPTMDDMQKHVACSNKLNIHVQYTCSSAAAGKPTSPTLLIPFMIHCRKRCDMFSMRTSQHHRGQAATMLQHCTPYPPPVAANNPCPNPIHLMTWPPHACPWRQPHPCAA
jgi:hypothetical protein